MNPKKLYSLLQKSFYYYGQFNMQVLTLLNYTKSKCKPSQVLQVLFMKKM